MGCPLVSSSLQSPCGITMLYFSCRKINPEGTYSACVQYFWRRWKEIRVQDPSDASAWNLLMDADERECALLSSVGQTVCQEGDQRCLYSSCLDSCGGNSLCDASNSLNNCSKYSL